MSTMDLGALLGGGGAAGGAGPSLADILGQAGQGPQDTGDQSPTDELAALQEVITDLHELITILSDPKDTAIASQCLHALTKVQADMMNERTSSAQQAIGSRLSRSGGGSAY